MRHLINQQKLTYCSSKFPGIPVGNFGGPRFQWIPGNLRTGIPGGLDLDLESGSAEL